MAIEKKYESLSKLPKSVRNVLPKAAQEIFRAAFNSAWAGTCKDGGKLGDREACSNAVAWTAVKKKYKKGPGKKWVPKAFAFSLPLSIVKITRTRKGVRRWRAHVSKDAVDLLGERLDVSLFHDFEENFKAGEPLFLDIAHLSFMVPDELVEAVRVGEADKLWVDGAVLKSTGPFYATPLAERAADRLEEDKEGAIRVSAGFFPDMGNVGYEDDIFVYKGGRGVGKIVHTALTTIPALPETMIRLENGDEQEADVTKSAADKVRADIMAILGGEEDDELVEELLGSLSDERLKSIAADLVIKAGDGDEDEDEDQDDEDEDEDEAAAKSEDNELVGTAPENWSDEELDADEESEEDLAKTNGDLQKARKAQKTRSTKFGIAVRKDGNITIPKREREAGATAKDYADPVNYLYPVWASKAWKSLEGWQQKQVTKAPARFAEFRDHYDAKSRGRVAARIAKALGKFKIGELSKEKIAKYGDAVEVYERPFGGATSLDDAQDWLDAAWVHGQLWTEWDMLSAVVRNILDDDSGVDEKLDAVAKVIAEFETRISDIESRKEKGMAKDDKTKGAVGTSQRVEPLQVGAVGEGAVAAQPASNVAAAAKSFGELTTRIMEGPEPMDEKREALGNALLETAGNLEEATRAEPAVDVGGIATAVGNAVREQLEPIMNAIRGQEQGEATDDDQPRPKPARKSVGVLPSAAVTKAQSWRGIVDRLIEE